MNMFFDTSALVKLFHDEPGSERVLEIIESDDNDIWILELARIEFLSALYRLRRNEEIDDAQLMEASDGFLEQLKEFHIEPMTQAVLREAEHLMRAHGADVGLRTLDALHLAAFSLIAGNDWRFVAADSGLCKSARKAGFEALDPLTKM